MSHDCDCAMCEEHRERRRLPDFGVAKYVAPLNPKGVMKMTKAKKLIEWKVDGNKYRLTTAGKVSAGYKDYYILEWEGQDSVGDPAWQKVVEFQMPDARATTHGLAINSTVALLQLVEILVNKLPAE